MVPAWADDISNDLDGTVDSAAEGMALTTDGEGKGTTTLNLTPRNEDGKTGCNIAAGTSLTVSVISSRPGVATVSPPSITFNTCGDRPTITVHAVGTGTSSVTLTQTGNDTGATFDLLPASFDVYVNGGNAAPAVEVTGVVDGGSYGKDSVPTAMCDVTDAEDGDGSFPATLSAIAGPYASDGIGSRTASCSYTDGGGLSARASITYDIVDPSAPTIDYAVTPTIPDGDNGWYRTDITVDWTVGDEESPGSLRTSGCDDLTLGADQDGATYTCTADSAGGRGEVSTVAIKRDATAPSVQFNGGPADGATYYQGLDEVPAAPTCDATDGMSGVDASGCVVAGYSTDLGHHVMSAAATDRAGNNGSAVRRYAVVECSADTAAVGTACAPKCDGQEATIKGSGGTVLGTEGDDVIVGSAAAETIDGLGGNDVICALDGADTVDAGDGNDRVFGGLGDDMLEAGVGSDTLVGGDGTDTLIGGADTNGDNLVGNGGPDQITGGSGADTISGGAGADTMSGHNGDDRLGGDLGDDTMTGGAGADVANGAGGNDHLGGGFGADILDGGFGHDLIEGGYGEDSLMGAAGADALLGQGDDDVLKGHAGDDLLGGGDGDDDVVGAEGLDLITGGDGADMTYGGDHADTVRGGSGNDVLNGGDGPDRLYGEAHDDVVNGNAGADLLDGGEGDDRLIGGPDEDVLDGGLGSNFIRQ